jgi:glucosamine--fructose-6-phosphate aminotransferase (isomerizing)
MGNIMEVKARKGIVIAIATEGNEDIKDKVDEVIYIPNMSLFKYSVAFALLALALGSLLVP